MTIKAPDKRLSSEIRSKSALSADDDRTWVFFIEHWKSLYCTTPETKRRNFFQILENVASDDRNAKTLMKRRLQTSNEDAKNNWPLDAFPQNHRFVDAPERLAQFS